MGEVIKAPVNADIETAKAHLYALFKPFADMAYEGKIEIRCIHPISAITTPMNFGIKEVDAAAQYAIDMNEEYNVYVGVNPRNKNTKGAGKATDVEIAYFHFVDADDTSSVEKLKTAPLKPNFVIETGREPNQRVHAYWRLEDPSRNLQQWQKQQEALADYFGGDRVIDPPRIMRLAGTVSHPSEKKLERGYKKERVRYIPKETRPPVEAEALRQTYVTDNNSPELSAEPTFEIDTGRVGRADAQIQQMLETTKQAGEWHNNMLRVVATLVGRNYSDFLIGAICAPYCDGGAADPDLTELIKTARQKWQMPDPGEASEVAEEESIKPPFEIKWSGDIAIRTETFDFVEDLLTDGGMSVLYGDSNTGKTFFASDLAFHVAQGKEWRGKAVEQGGVIYLALEGARGIDNRIVAYNKHYNLDTNKLPFGRIATTIDLCNNETDASRLIMAIEQAMEQIGQPIRMVVVDTLSRALNGGNENAPDSMGALVNNCDRIRHATGAHVMLVHHTGKNQAAGARGHSLLRAATDTEIEVVADRDAQISAAKVTKQRDMEVDGEYAFKLKTVELGKNDRGKIITSCVVEATDASVTATYRPNGNVKLALDALHVALADSKKSLPETYPVRSGAKMSHWREIFANLHGGTKTDTVRKAFNRAANELKTKDFCGFDGVYVWSRDKRDIAGHEEDVPF
jgi:hypothetical protein